MQELRFVAVSEDGSYAILAVPGRSGRYVLPIDERLRAIANGQTSRLAQYEIEVESPLRPKEIQARIRAGETAEEIADAAGIPVERVRWFEGPVLAERAYIADQAQTASVRRAGDAGPGPRLGEIVPARLTASGADPEDAQWDSRKRGDGNWQVTLSFPSAGRVHIAEWVFDPRRRHVAPDDDNAARLSLPESELPPEPVAMPGEATVTPLAPRLGAAAGMGGGGMGGSGMGGGGIGGPGGFAGGGSGVGVRSFRPDRSVIPDRSLSADRTLADRSLADRSLAADRTAVIPRPGQDHTVHHDHTAFRDSGSRDGGTRDGGSRDSGSRDAGVEDTAAEPTAYRAPEPVAFRESAPAPVPATTPTPAPYREPVQEPAAYREPVQEPAAYREPVSGRPAPPRPVVFEEPEPDVLFENPAPRAVPDDQQESGQESASAPAPTARPVSAAPWIPRTAPEPELEPELEPAPVAEREHVPAPIPAPAATAAPSPTPATDSVAAPEQPTTPRPEPATLATPPTQTIAATQRPPTQAAPATRTAPDVSVTPVASVTPDTAEAAPVEAAPAEATTAPTTAPAPEVEVAVEAEAPATPDAPAQPDAAETTPAKDEGDTAPSSADDQSGRPRSGSKRNAKGRRSSVPSWDEIMLGSSRQRD